VGEPSRVEVRPARKLMRPGEDFSFQARVVDDKGCKVDARPSWAVGTAGSKLSVDGSGTVHVPSDAPEGTTEVVVSFAGQHVRVGVEVASVDRYESLLTARGLNERGEADETAVVTIATGRFGGGKAVGEDTPRRRKILFLSIVGAIAVALGLGGALVLRRGSRKKATVVEEEAEEAAADSRLDHSQRQQRRGAVDAGQRRDSERSSCPTCHRDFAAAGLFCPHDGTRLVRLSDAQQIPAGPAAGRDAGAAQHPVAAGPKGKICPTCGARYGGEATFCGKDGTSLLLVN
jgi:hypothetical protein